MRMLYVCVGQPERSCVLLSVSGLFVLSYLSSIYWALTVCRAGYYLFTCLILTETL